MNLSLSVTLVSYKAGRFVVFVSSEFLPHLDAVHVEHNWLHELSTLVEPHRPMERRMRDRIDVSKTKAVLATDLVGGKGWAVEIKVRHTTPTASPRPLIVPSFSLPTSHS